MSIDQEVLEPSSDGEASQEPAGDEVPVAQLVHQALTSNPILLLDLLIVACQRAKDALLTPPAQLYAVTTPDGEEMVATPVDSMEEMMAKWRDVYAVGGQGIGFRGEIILPSKDGKFGVSSFGRFLIHTDSQATDVDPSGRLGVVPPVPRLAPVPAAAVVEEAPYEEVADLEPDEFEDQGGDEEGEDDVDDDE